MNRCYAFAARIEVVVKLPMRIPLKGKRFLLQATVTIVWILASAICNHASPQGPPEVSKVDPPSWWARHTINPVRLLVRGKNLGGARVRSANPAIRVFDVLVNNNGTYLFASVNISPAARPGEYPLTVATAGGHTTIPFHIEPALETRSHFQGITADDVIYLIMPDR